VTCSLNRFVDSSTLSRFTNTRTALPHGGPFLCPARLAIVLWPIWEQLEGGSLASGKPPLLDKTRIVREKGLGMIVPSLCSSVWRPGARYRVGLVMCAKLLSAAILGDAVNAAGL
jgi:hypothetical protein